MLEVVGKMIPFLFCPVHFLFLAINESFGGLAAQSPAPEDQVAMARVKSWVGGGDKTLRFLVKVGSLEDQMGRFFVCVAAGNGMPNELWYPKVWQALLQIILVPFNPRKQKRISPERKTSS